MKKETTTKPFKGTVYLWHKDGICVDDKNVKIYVNGKLAKTKGELQQLTIKSK